MKKHALFTLLPLSAVALSGCFSFYNKVEQSEFLGYINQVENTLNSDNEQLENVSIKKRMDMETFNYKEGEFYRHYWWAILIIVPVFQTECTWTENGKYYHYVKDDLNTKNNVDKEITEEEFNTYMASHRVKVIDKLTEAVDKTKYFFNPESEPTYTTETYKDNHGKYKVVAEYELPDYSTEDENDTIKGKHTIVFGNNLPISWDNKEGSSKDHWKYSYGNAKFTNPHDNQEE